MRGLFDPFSDLPAAAPCTEKKENFRAFRFFGFFSEFKKKLVEGLFVNENEKGKRGKGEIECVCNCKILVFLQMFF